MNMLFILLMPALAQQPATSAEEIRVYTQQTSKKSINVLRIYPDNTYSYCRYTASKVLHDTGIFSPASRKLKLQSTQKRHAFNPFTQHTGFIGRKGIYLKTSRGILARKPDFSRPADVEPFLQYWEISPLTNTRYGAKQPRATSLPTKTKNPMAKEAARRYYIQTSNLYNPGYSHLLEQSYCGPGIYQTYINGSFIPWNEDTTATTLFQHLNTVIHESVHQHNTGERYTIIPGIEINIPTTETFHSADFKLIVPNDLKKAIFRYETYVSESSKVGANVSGIYGLLDEFSAYMNGTRFCVQAAQLSNNQGDYLKAGTMLKQAGQTYFAWHEFRLFIAWYLHYAFDQRRDVYNKLMDNNNLRLTFTLIDDEFKSTIKLAEKVCVNGDCGAWKSKTANYLSYEAPCTKALKTEEKWLTEFRLQGANLANYRDFITTR
jgi:hypothetical protein